MSSNNLRRRSIWAIVGSKGSMIGTSGIGARCTSGSFLWKKGKDFDFRIIEEGMFQRVVAKIMTCELVVNIKLSVECQHGIFLFVLWMCLLPTLLQG
jgi:hypothetical protein